MIFEISVAFLAGILTVLAPCVFILLPIILLGSAKDKSLKRPAAIILSLSLTIFLVTILIKFGEQALFNVSEQTLFYISGTIIVFFGLTLLFPEVWAKLSYKIGLSNKSDQLLQKTANKKGLIGDILTGAALGPAFASCSPTYFVILNLSIIGSFTEAVVYLIFYILGFALILFLIAIFGQSFIQKFKWAANPSGSFRKFLGIVFIIVGVIIFFGLQKDIQTTLVESGLYDTLQLFEAELNQKAFEK